QLLDDLLGRAVQHHRRPGARAAAAAAAVGRLQGSRSMGHAVASSSWSWSHDPDGCQPISSAFDLLATKSIVAKRLSCEVRTHRTRQLPEMYHWRRPRPARGTAA